MNYEYIYKRLIDTRTHRPAPANQEKHHIIPRSLGGSNDASNIISLSPREHFIAHLLLAKIHGGPMWAALAFMSRGGTKSARGHKCTSRQYETISIMDASWRREKYSGKGNPFFGMKHDSHALSKMRKPRANKAGMYGNHRPHNGAIISFVRTYKPNAVTIDISLRNFIDERMSASDELRKMGEFYRRVDAGKRKMEGVDVSGDKNPNYGNGAAISGDKNPMFGKEHSEETKRKIGEKASRTIKCPHCGKESNIANAHRWHLDNCKRK